MRFEACSSDGYDEGLVSQPSERVAVLRGMLQHWIAVEALRHTGVASELLGIIWSNQDRGQAMDCGDMTGGFATWAAANDADSVRAEIIDSLSGYVEHCPKGSDEYVAADELATVLRSELQL